MVPTARLLILVGIVMISVGAIILVASRLGFNPDRLPGNIQIERGNLTCVFGLGISLLLSILLTLILNLLARFMNK